MRSPQNGPKFSLPRSRASETIGAPMLSKFDDTLPSPAGRGQVAGRPAGPCTMGPVGDGDTLTWMRVWVHQRAGGRVAAASGTSGEDARTQAEHRPFRERWMIRTGLEPGSDQFLGAPATALALALVTRADGSKDVEQWSQEVTIDTQAPEPA
jgi:hypothetical protein